MGKAHIIGAGLAGLSTAVQLAERGHEVCVYEAAGQAGGRCRSFYDKTLDHQIDNGNHLLLSGNRAALGFLNLIGSGDSLMGPERAAFPFYDLATEDRWTIEPRGRLPLWILRPDRRVPDTGLFDYLKAIRLVTAGPDRTVSEVVGKDGPMFRRFWDPLTVATLNMAPEKASAKLLWSVLAETFAKGEPSCRPLIARDGLGPSLVAPALAFLENSQVPVSFNRTLRRVQIDGNHVTCLDFGNIEVPVEADDTVVIAVPGSRAAGLVPGLETPGEGEVIVNAHFRVDPLPTPMSSGPLLGLIGGLTQWIFIRDEIISVTISAATDISDRPADALAADIWQEVSRALRLQSLPLPPVRIIKEKRATFDQSPQEAAKRPHAKTAFPNLILAGDWTATGIPATIEGAIRSGHTAAGIVARRAGA